MEGTSINPTIKTANNAATTQPTEAQALGAMVNLVLEFVTSYEVWVSRKPETLGQKMINLLFDAESDPNVEGYNTVQSLVQFVMDFSKKIRHIAEFDTNIDGVKTKISLVSVQPGYMVGQVRQFHKFGGVANVGSRATGSAPDAPTATPAKRRIML